jgi:hypothetical protein
VVRPRRVALPARDEKNRETIKRREEVATQMTPEQIADGQKRAREWKAEVPPAP